MTYEDDINALASRLSKAEADRDAWKAAGLQERYLAAYFLVESLEANMFERMRRERIENSPE